MRTFKHIYIDYCTWIVEKTGNRDYSYEALVEKYGEQNIDVVLYKDLLKKFYDKNFGFFYFSKFLIGDLQEVGYPKPFRYNTLLRKWHKLIQTHKYLAILCARGHGKSVYFSQVNNIYDMFLYKFKRIIIISASQEQANEHIDNIKILVDNNEWLSEKKDNKRWAVERISYNSGFIMAAGIGSEILGHHVDRIVIDDILRSDNRLSDQEVEDYIDMNLSPMLLNRQGQMILVGTPKSESDIFSTLKKRIKEESKCPWVIKEYKAVLDYDKKILQCPDRFTWEQIMEKRLTMGSLKFSREYQLEFFSRDKSLFPDILIKLAKDKGKDMRLLYKFDKRGPEWIFVIGVDVARSGSASADYTVAIVLAYNSVTQAKQIVHMWREKGLKITKQAEHIAKIARSFNNATVLVEQNNMGQDMIDELADTWNVGVESFVTGGKGQKKDELIRFLITSFEHEQLIIPQGDDQSITDMNALCDELSKFCVTHTPAGNEKFEGAGSHDDCVISLALANKATQILGAPFALTNFSNDRNVKDSNVYEAFLSRNTGESDLVKLIRMGVIR